ncbi:sodium-dependent transporter [Lagierella sp.]|uniref:sodium-dependent transporter n=1 Tax=Lagierella sp. TaxID=2849657 RepID=UPI00260BEBF1|nr:sodium-dependent transporter [Lagierella sp.]
MNKRQGFSSSLGMIMATAGSAVGVGNIWRFPYILGEYGGAAFLIVYLLMVLLIGIPLMVTEMAIGRMGREDASKSFKKIAPNTKWYLSGFLGILAAFIILGYYSVVAGWTLKYIVNSLTGVFNSGLTPEKTTTLFNNFVSSGLEPILYTFVFMAITMFIVYKGIEGGIEKASKTLLPILAIILVILAIRSLTLPGAYKGVEFLLKPDFKAFFQKKDAILVAMGHAFYSLSLGMGILITFGSYMSQKDDLSDVAVKIAITDTIIAVLAGFVIFPAVFSFGLAPSQGPGLVFVSLPNVFGNMFGGKIFSALFFTLLAFSALTSTISLLETVVSYFIDSLGLKRSHATLLSGGLIFIICIFSSLSMGSHLGSFRVFGKSFFDFLDYITANVFLLVAAFVEVVFMGWFFKKNKFVEEITELGLDKNPLTDLIYNSIKFIIPVVIVVLFIANNGLIK